MLKESAILVNGAALERVTLHDKRDYELNPRSIQWKPRSPSAQRGIRAHRSRRGPHWLRLPQSRVTFGFPVWYGMAVAQLHKSTISLRCATVLCGHGLQLLKGELPWNKIGQDSMPCHSRYILFDIVNFLIVATQWCTAFHSVWIDSRGSSGTYIYIYYIDIAIEWLYSFQFF